MSFGICISMEYAAYLPGFEDLLLWTDPMTNNTILLENCPEDGNYYLNVNNNCTLLFPIMFSNGTIITIVPGDVPVNSTSTNPTDIHNQLPPPVLNN